MNRQEWKDKAACFEYDTNLFFDKYEADVNIAKSIDEACFSCPVSKMCYQTGVENDEQGVWGGIYLNSGSIDKTRNLHKTPEAWKKIRTKNGIHK